MSDPTAASLQAARRLASWGVPIFLAKPDPEFPRGGHGDTGYQFPYGWQRTEPDPTILDEYEPGDAVCAVTGVVVDGLDLDAHKGGRIPDDLRPISYGTQRTPSGGTHDLIAPLGVPSKDGILPGVDVKSGVAGAGRGFLFLAPTRKTSKATGEVAQYEWITEPDLTGLILVGSDDSGRGLADLIQQGRSPSGSITPDYHGVHFEDLDSDRQRRATQYQDAQLFDWQMTLAEAAAWDEGERDSKGRGWEALARDAAWTVAMLAVCPWTPLDPDEAEDTYHRILPEQIANDPKCRGKWYEGILEKAAARPVDLPPWWSETLFERTSVLEVIRDSARARKVSPEGVLACTLARVIAEAPPTVMLPPTAGSAAGLNFGVALMGVSGSGKSSIMDVSAEVLGIHGLDQEDIQNGAGSGEGMIDLLLDPEILPNAKGEMKPTGQMVLKPDPRVILVVDEVTHLGATGSERKGSTLPGLLRSALTSGPLQIANARAGGRSRNVRKNTYRMMMLVGVQPSASGVLLGEANEGTPQRFLWTGTSDPDRPKDGIRPSFRSLEWEPPSSWPDWVEYPEHVEEEILQTQDRVLDLAPDQIKDETEALDGHIMLLRLKIAFALALLHGETKISDGWWDLAGQLCDRSQEIQQACLTYLGRTNVERAYRSERTKSEAQARVVGDRLERAADSVVRKLKKHPGQWLTWRTVRPGFDIRRGLEPDEIRETVADDPKIGVRQHPQQTGWQLCYDPPEDDDLI